MINTRKIVKPEGKEVDEFESRVAQELFNIEVRSAPLVAPWWRFFSGGAATLCGGVCRAGGARRLGTLPLAPCVWVRLAGVAARVPPAATAPLGWCACL